MLSNFRKTSPLALAKGVMGMIEVWAENSRSKRATGPLSGLDPSPKGDFQTKQFSLWVGTASHICFSLYMPTSLPLDEVGRIVLLCLGSNHSFLTCISTIEEKLPIWLNPSFQALGQGIWSSKPETGNLHVWATWEWSA